MDHLIGTQPERVIEGETDQRMIGLDKRPQLMVLAIICTIGNVIMGRPGLGVMLDHFHDPAAPGRLPRLQLN